MKNSKKKGKKETKQINDEKNSKKKGEKRDKIDKL